jgi:hypothetical protein
LSVPAPPKMNLCFTQYAKLLCKAVAAQGGM